MATEIKYVKGDVRNPIGSGLKLIVHCCNDLGVMGAGVAKAISDKWPQVKEEYVKWGKGEIFSVPFGLGRIQIVKVEDDIRVANMIGQHDIRTINGIPPVRYESIRECLQKVSEYAKKNNASIHCPYLMASALAGGKWEVVEKIIISTLCENDISVTVYDFDGKRG